MGKKLEEEFQEIKSIISLNSLKSGLFQGHLKETKELIGLKGGADHAILENKIMVRIDHTAQDSISSIYSFYFDSLK